MSASFVATASLGASTSAGVQVNIAGIQTSTSLASTPNPSYPGQAVVLVATVFSSAPSQPLAGTVRFLDGSTNLGDVMLDARGSASLTSSTLDTGTHAIQAMYLGSGAQIASQSNVLQQVVLDSSFTATADPQQLTIQTQHHATFHLNLTSVGRFSGLVTLTCGTLPLHATCRINPLTVNLTAGGTQSASVYLDTSDVIGYASASPAPLSRRSNGVVYAVLLLPVLTGLVGWRTRPLRGGVLLLMVMSLTLLGIVGCSGKYPASVAPGGYTLHFTATSNSSPAMQTAPLSLTVTP